MSFHLGYREYNTFFTNTMTDEVRKVNDHLYLGMGRLTATFGKLNPMLFVLLLFYALLPEVNKTSILKKMLDFN